MENKRSLKELYKILLQDFVSLELVGNGICGIISHMYHSQKITRQEYLALDLDFQSRMPKWYNSKFWWSKHFTSNGPQTYWWERTENGWNCRVEFIKHIINKLK